MCAGVGARRGSGDAGVGARRGNGQNAVSASERVRMLCRLVCAAQAVAGLSSFLKT